jgi:hypothetical protein
MTWNWKSGMQSSPTLWTSHQGQLVPCILLTVQALHLVRVDFSSLSMTYFNSQYRGCFRQMIFDSIHLFWRIVPFRLSLQKLPILPLLGMRKMEEKRTILPNWNSVKKLWLCLRQTAWTPWLVALGQSRRANRDVSPYVTDSVRVLLCVRSTTWRRNLVITRQLWKKMSFLS